MSKERRNVVGFGCSVCLVPRLNVCQACSGITRIYFNGHFFFHLKEKKLTHVNLQLTSMKWG